MDLRGFGLSDDDLRQLGYDVKRPPGSGAGPGPGRSGPSGTGPRPTRGTSPDAPREPAPSKKWAPATRTWLTSLVVLAAASWASGSGRWLPRPAPVSAPDTAFSSGRAMAQLVEVAREARPPGSPAHERARTYLLGRLRSLGLEPEVQTATVFVRESGQVRAATVRNVVARIPGAEPTGAVLLTAPYDTGPHSPGAGDNGMGVAAALEVVRALTVGPPLRNDVLVLLADGDELGRLGSRAFSAGRPGLPEATVVLSVEGRGVSGPAVLFETGPGNGRLVELLAEVEPRPAALAVARSARSAARESLASDELWGGAPVVSLATLGDAAFQHQPRDTRERVSEASLQHAGRQLLGLTRALGSVDLGRELSAADRVYLSLPRVGALHYPRAWVPLIMLGLLALWTLAALVLRGRRATRVGVAVGFAGGVATIGAAAAAAGGLRDLATEWHPEFGTLSTAFYEDGAYALAAVALAIACGSVIYVIGKRWARPDELVFGGLCVPLVYASWLTFTDPFAGAALQLPLAAALLGGALVIVLGPNRAGTAWAWGALLTLTAAALALTVPGVELLATVWTFHEAPRIGAVAGLGVLLLWPLMERLLMPRFWWTPLVATGAAAALVGLTLPAMRDVDEHPAPTTLVYLTEEPVIEPVRPQAVSLERDSVGTRSMAGRWLTARGRDEAWARSWAGEAATGHTGAGVLLIGRDSLFEITGTAPVSELVAPRATVSAIVDEGGMRRVELAVRSGLDGELLGIHIPEGAPGSLVGVGDALWGGGGPVRSVVHWGRPATTDLRVHVQVGPDDTQLSLLLLEHHLRPREILGSYFFQRPDSLVPNVAVGSDRVIQRTLLRVPLQEPTTGGSGDGRSAYVLEPSGLGRESPRAGGQ